MPSSRGGTCGCDGRRRDAYLPGEPHVSYWRDAGTTSNGGPGLAHRGDAPSSDRGSALNRT